MLFISDAFAARALPGRLLQAGLGAQIPAAWLGSLPWPCLVLAMGA